MLIVLAAIGAAAEVIRPGLLGNVLGQEQHKGTYYYRFRSAYEYKGERIDFNVVAGCAIRVTTDPANGSSWDAFRYPSNVVVATKSGGALWQYVQDACLGQTTTNGKVPHDFLPSVIVFEDARDLTFGVGYVSEDAFNQSQSPIKFLGASIEAATWSEFDDYQRDAPPNLIDPMPFTRQTPAPTPEEVGDDPWNKKKWEKWGLNVFECFGYERRNLIDPADRDRLQKMWPAHQPRFWRPARDEDVHGMRLGLVDPESKRFITVGNGLDGFPTKAGGGRFTQQTQPVPVFPFIQQDAVPWFGPPLLDVNLPIFRDIVTSEEATLGQMYCYSYLQPQTWFLKRYLTNYIDHEFIMRVDGSPVDFGQSMVGKPNPFILFFEKTDFVFVPVRMTLH